MKTKAQVALKMSLREAGYSERTAEQVLRLYTLPENTNAIHQNPSSYKKKGRKLRGEW